MTAAASSVTGSIAIECTCGKRGFIAARLAGRKVRCTGCGQPVRVPAASGSEVSAPPSDERLELMAPSVAPSAAGGLDLLPEVTRTFHDPAALSRQRREPAGVGEAPRKKRSGTGLRRDPDWERHVRGIAFWPMFTGVVCLAGTGVGAVAVLMSALPLRFVFAFVLSMLAVSALHGAYGFFLWRYNGVARVLHLVVSGAMTALGMIALIQVPGVAMKIVTLLELAWPAATFAVLMDPRAGTICTAPYRTLVRRTPNVRVAWWTSPFFYVPIVLTLFAVIMIVSLMASAGIMMR